MLAMQVAKLGMTKAMGEDDATPERSEQYIEWRMR